MVYERKSISGRRSKIPTTFWEGKQGLLNAGVILRCLIAKQEWIVDNSISEKLTSEWVEKQGLRKPCREYGLYGLLISAYPEYSFDPKRPTAFHLHPWDMGWCRWNESLAREAVRHTVHFHMPWGLPLCELMGQFTSNFLTQQNLGGLTDQIERNPYRLFIYGFPEYVFDPAQPDRPHVHPWDAPRTMWSDDLIREAIQHMIKYHTDWSGKYVANATKLWFDRVRMEALLKVRFRNSPYRALKFAYPELFERGVLSEEYFRNLGLGRGIGRFRHPLRRIDEKQPRGSIRIQGTQYHFPNHCGYLIHRISQEYGALYLPDKKLIGLFKWNNDPSIRHVSIREKDLEPVPPELTRPRRHLAFAEAVRVLADEVQIVVHALPLKDQIALTDAFETVQPAQVVGYLKLTGETGLRAMADTEFSAALVRVHELFNPVEFRQMITQYNKINAKLEDVSILFIRNAVTIQQAKRDAFYAEMKTRLFSANDRIINALSQALIYRDQKVRDKLSGNVLRAQRDFAAMIEVLDAFGHGTFRVVRDRNREDGAREIQ